jgi:plasmid stabilization system protein ParE
MSSVIWSPLAELELEEILFCIAFESGRPETADRIGREIRDAAEDLSRQGGKGHRHPALPSG